MYWTKKLGGGNFTVKGALLWGPLKRAFSTLVKRSNVGLLNTESQLNAIKELTRQMELADASKLPIIMMGDANLCSMKWKGCKVSLPYS